MVSGWILAVAPIEDSRYSLGRYVAIDALAAVGAFFAMPRFHPPGYKDGPAAVVVGFALLFLYSGVRAVQLVISAV